MKIGIDIGGSHIAIATVNSKGKIIEKIEQDIIKQQNMEEYIVNYVDKIIEKLSKTADIEEIGIAAPGNPKETVIMNLVNLGITKIDFKILKTKYNVKVKSINDAKAAALAEKEYGAMKGSKDSVFLCLGTGIGGGVFFNNNLLKANKNPGFELGHMIIDRNGKPCNCGKRGCFETYCSMKRLKEELKEKIKKVEPDVVIKDAITLKRILEKNIGNIEVREIIDEYIENLIIGLSNIIDIFEPEIICLGGSFVYYEDILYKELVTKMKERKYAFNKDSLPKIELAKLQNDAGIIGATLIS